MNLKDFLATRDKPPELYWSLVMETGWIQAGIWYIGETSAEVVSVSPPTAWETEEELVGAADAALSSSVQKLPEDYTEPSKTVFGVPAAWVKGGEILEEYLAKIKTLCGDLSLTPVGFVVLPEAIAHLYKSLEGSPLNAVIVGLGRDALEVSVFKLGNLVGNSSVARSVSLIEDVTEGLSRFEGASPLPSRIIVFDGKGGELEEAKETLMQESWDKSEKVKFLHTPKVEIFPSDRKVIAVSLAGANEIGHVSKVEEKEGPAGEVAEEIAAEEVSVSPDIENVTEPAEDVTPEKLGFVIGEDVSVTENASVSDTPFAPAPPVNIPASSPVTPKISYFQKTKNLFHNFSKRIPIKYNSQGHINRTKPLIGTGIALALILIAGFAAWWFLPKATVTVFVSPKQFSQETNISFSTVGKSDVATGIIPGTLITDNVNGDKTKATTGTKLIGNKAKGAIVIGNTTSNIITLAAGTLITSSGGLNFTLDNSASISAALDSFHNATTNANVTAADIGAQYNLAKDEVFKIGNFARTNVSAQSTADFTGGSSQEISAVSATDQTNLETDLKNELLQKAVDDLSAKISSGQVFVNDAAKIDVTTETFDHKVGDQADNIKLTLALTVSGIGADNAKLLEYSKAVLKDKVPGGYVLRDSQISYKFTFVKIAGDLYNYNVQISANFLPIENTDAIIAQIKGKTTDVAQSYLNSIPGFTRAEVKLTPNLPGFLGTLPRVAKNITINVVAEQ